MRFKYKLLQGTLIKRYKRFFVDVRVNNKTITAHCPNSGSMMGLLDKNNKVWISKSKNPKRKLKYTLELIKVKDSLVGVNTIFANKIVFEALIGWLNPKAKRPDAIVYVADVTNLRRNLYAMLQIRRI